MKKRRLSNEYHAQCRTLIEKETLFFFIDTTMACCIDKKQRWTFPTVLEREKERTSCLYIESKGYNTSNYNATQWALFLSPHQVKWGNAEDGFGKDPQGCAGKFIPWRWLASFEIKVRLWFGANASKGNSLLLPGQTEEREEERKREKKGRRNSSIVCSCHCNSFSRCCFNNLLGFCLAFFPLRTLTQCLSKMKARLVTFGKITLPVVSLT